MTYLKQAFGQNLRKIRKDKGFTQEQLAELVNLNQRQLTRIENGFSFVSSAVLEKLVYALNVDVKTLFDFELKETILNKTGTEDTPQYRIIKTDNIIKFQKVKSYFDENKIEEEKIINAEPEKYLLETAKNLNKPITVQYFNNEVFSHSYVYFPNGKINLIKNKNNEDNKNIEKIIEKIQKLSENKQQLNYINTAIDSLSSKTARNKLKILIDGMNLIE